MRIASAAAGTAAAIKAANLTLPKARKQKFTFEQTDLLVLAYPVYGGRMPLPLVEQVQRLRGEGTAAVIAAVYGNRAFEDALVEAADLLSGNGFVVIAGAAIIGEHSYTRQLATGRPNRDDLQQAEAFGRVVAAMSRSALAPADLPGNRPYKPRRGPLQDRPKTNADCFDCLACAAGCPMGVISHNDPRQVNDGCIRCNACVKVCPVNAKSFGSQEFLDLRQWLLDNFMERKENQFFY